MAYMYVTLLYFRSTTFQICGTSYYENDVLVLGFLDDEPRFGIIDYLITTIDEKCYIVLYSLHTIGYSSHFHSYKVFKTTSLVVCSPDNLVDHHPLTLSRNYETSCNHYKVSLKYHLLQH